MTYVSCIANKEGNAIERWALYGPPKKCSLDWPVRRKPLPENLKAWRVMIYTTITVANGLYPTNLGPPVSQNLIKGCVVGQGHQQASIHLQHMNVEYKKLIGNFEYTGKMVEDFIECATQGIIYAGSNG